MNQSAVLRGSLEGRHMADCNAVGPLFLGSAQFLRPRESAGELTFLDSASRAQGPDAEVQIGCRAVLGYFPISFCGCGGLSKCWKALEALRATLRIAVTPGKIGSMCFWFNAHFQMLYSMQSRRDVERMIGTTIKRLNK